MHKLSRQLFLISWAGTCLSTTLILLPLAGITHLAGWNPSPALREAIGLAVFGLMAGIHQRRLEALVRKEWEGLARGCKQLLASVIPPRWQASVVLNGAPHEPPAPNLFVVVSKDDVHRIASLETKAERLTFTVVDALLVTTYLHREGMVFTVELADAADAECREPGDEGDLPKGTKRGKLMRLADGWHIIARLDVHDALSDLHLLRYTKGAWFDELEQAEGCKTN